MSALTVALAAFVLSLVGCEIVRRVALRRNLLNAVNERSVHTLPPPRLGGLAIAATAAAVATVSTWSTMPRDLALLLAACSAVALVGLRDDLKPMPALPRLLIQIAAAGAFLHFAGPTPPLLVTRDYALPLPAALTTVLLVIWIVGVLNIYNFMDGMDGLAASQAAFAALPLALVFAAEAGLQSFALVLGAATLGFLAHNFRLRAPAHARSRLDTGGNPRNARSSCAIARRRKLRVMLHDGI